MKIEYALAELQHYIYTHVMVQGGPNPQLCVFLTKLLDFMDDLYAAIRYPERTAEHLERIEQEVQALSFHIIESLAVWLATSLNDEKFQIHLRHQGRQLLVLVAKAKPLPDKLSAKEIVLRGIADVIRSLKAANPKLAYPDVKDAKNNVL
jgi:hypothetical protein